MEFIALFQRGGMAMYPILACSIIAVAVFLERLWRLRSSRLIPEGFVRKFRESVLQDEIEVASRLCSLNAHSPLARVAQAALKHRGQSPDMIRFMVSEVASQEAVGLERFQAALGTIAYLSPLLGLFGTVSGMIKAFDVVSKHVTVDPPMLAAGISEALITTFAGLAVAIPTVVMDRYVQSRAERISLELEKKSTAIAEVLIMDSGKSTQRPARAGMSDAAKSHEE
jgi:biopolymer transport protein ExbB